LLPKKTGNEIIVYVRDASGSPIGFEYHGANYSNISGNNVRII